MTRRYDRASRRHVRGVAPFGRFVSAAARTKEQHDKLTPDDIIALMKQGNERFRLGQESPHDYLAQQKASARGQCPAAVLLSCIDSRAGRGDHGSERRRLLQRARSREHRLADLRRRSAILPAVETSGAVNLVGAMYNLETGLVEFFG